MQTDPESKHWSEHILVKMIIIGIIIIALMIPSVMINELVRERANRKMEVTNEVSSKWGQLQTIIGPYVEVPYLVELKNIDKVSDWREEKLFYFPKNLEINGVITPVEKKRSIFKVMLYQCELSINGNFDSPNLKMHNISSEHVMWEKASLHMAITDLSGIAEEVNLKIGDTVIAMTSASPTGLSLPNGLMANLPDTQNEIENMNFEIVLNLKGSQGIYFSPVAGNNKINLTSPWPSPKFEGQFLPDSSTITNTGFVANWSILDINRLITQQWTDNNIQPFSNASQGRIHNQYMTDMAVPSPSPVLGVELLDTVDHYTKNERTVKYAFLLITLTFVIYFFCEVLKKQRVHPLQYGLVGAALVIFFILLLSLSEQIGFDLAYLFSSIATIILITLYSRSIFSEKKNATLVGGLLLLQFAFIYVILQLEDFALLAGSIALFAIIALIMYLTRKVKW
ncbi:MAG TPA: cell envelope integrity protein CreD [Saprospiraceae bacterium]|nr:cell envelope integrity protein CreD [Saprospiraceae bacterium]